jgi:hypothetical protein
MSIAVTIIASAAAVLGFCTAVLGLVNRKKIDQNTEKTQEIHVLVNSKLTAWIDRSGQLLDALNQAGIEVPKAPTGTTPDP